MKPHYFPISLCHLARSAALAWPLLGGTGFAQETNAPKTILETFDSQTGVIVIKGSMVSGSVVAESGVVSVKCKESRDASTGRGESGLAIEVSEGQVLVDTAVVDYDELDSFLKAIDYISRADYRVTALPLFDVTYVTRGGFKISTYSSTRTPGTIKVALQSNHLNHSRVLLSPQQLAQFLTLVQQAKAKLDSLRTAK